MKEWKYNIGDKVVCRGLVGIIERRDHYMNGEPCYSLTAEADEEISCTAAELECEPFIGQEIDQSCTLSQAKIINAMTIRQIDNLTDKYFRDGCH